MKPKGGTRNRHPAGIAIATLVALMFAVPVRAQPAMGEVMKGEVMIHAAGSLRGALSEAADVWQASQPRARVRLTVWRFGPGRRGRGARFVEFLLGPQGQAVLAKHGFAPP